MAAGRRAGVLTVEWRLDPGSAESHCRTPIRRPRRLATRVANRLSGGQALEGGWPQALEGGWPQDGGLACSQ